MNNLQSKIVLRHKAGRLHGAFCYITGHTVSFMFLESFTCPGLYRCHGNQHCVTESDICDGIKHCPDGDDEWFCGKMMCR